MSTKSPEYTHFLVDRTFLSIITAIHHFHNTFYPVSLQNTENKKDRRKSKRKPVTHVGYKILTGELMFLSLLICREHHFKGDIKKLSNKYNHLSQIWLKRFSMRLHVS